MTLVVAHRISYGVWLAADMRVTNPAAARPVSSYSTAVLKLLILHPKLCVAFAGGPVEAALDAIRALDVGPESNIGAMQVGERLLEAHLHLDQSADFIVAGVSPTALLVIKDGTLTCDPSSAWIGDPDAFAEFQAVFTGAALWFPAQWELSEAERADWTEQKLAGRAQVRQRKAEALAGQELWPGELSDEDILDRATDAMHAVIDSGIQSVGGAGDPRDPAPSRRPRWCVRLPGDGLDFPRSGRAALGAARVSG